MAKKKEWQEGEIIVTFNLKKSDIFNTPLMEERLSVEPPIFDMLEEGNFQKLLKKTNKIARLSA